MPRSIIRNFQKKYGAKKGKKVFYATANKQNRDPETFQSMHDRGMAYGKMGDGETMGGGMMGGMMGGKKKRSGMMM